MIADTRHRQRGYLLPSLWLGRLIVLVLMVSAMPGRAADEKSWELATYRVQLHVVVDSSARPGALSAEQLSAELMQRIRTTIYPLWIVEVVLPQGRERTYQLHSLIDFPDEEEKSGASKFDKQMFLTAQVSPVGILLSSREFDCYTGRWTPILKTIVRQEHMVSQQSLELLCRVFAPLAMVRVDPDDEEQVSLLFKGEDLPRQTTETLFVREGDLFQPLLVRLSRTSGAAPEMIANVPWTFLVAEKPGDAGWQCRVFTGTRRPFGMRRRGRVELMALGLKTPLTETMIRFHASHDESQGLRGYEVFEQDLTSGEYNLLGVTNYQGSIPIEKTGAPVRMLVLRSDNQLLAKVPIIPGATTETQIPIADDVARLLVKEEMEVLKERLIDVVARRNILMARVRAFLEQGQLDDAEALVAELNALPNRADFAQEIESLQALTQSRGNNQYHSENPRIQGKINKLLENTRALLGRFLGVREITQLENEVREYQRNNENKSPG